MARSRLQDPLQNFAFWLLDVGPTQPLALPIFTPSLGFQSITAPELELDVEEIKEGNWPLKRKIITGGSTNTITLTRAVTLGDSDFYRWVMVALHGDKSLFGGEGPLGIVSVGGPTYRRELMLIQFLARTTSKGEGGAFAAATAALGAAAAGAGGGVLATIGSLAVAQALGIGPFETFSRMPAKAWLLHGCIPTRYKAAGDFDAGSSDVSVAELDFAYEGFDEINLAE